MNTLTVTLAAAAALAGPALADDFPAKPVRLVVNFAAGGPSDAIARALAHKTTELWGQQTVVDFRGGAAGNIGADHVAKAPPDGYTLLFMSGSFLTNPALSAKLPFDPVRDFTPLTPAAVGGMILVTHPSLPAKSVKTLIALAQRSPGKLTFASSGTGGSLHLNMALFNLMAGTHMLHVPYKGAGPAMIDVVGGQVDMMFIALPPTLPHLRAGKLAAIAVGSARRAPALPEVPTVAESGLPGFDVNSHFGVLGPAGLTPAVTTRLNHVLVQALRAPDTRERFASLGVDPAASSPEDYGRYIRSEIAKWQQVVKRAGLRPE